MNTNVLPNSLIFEGVLDEETAQTDLTNALAKLMASGGKPPVTLDFSKVVYCNSAGIIVWIRFLRESKLTFKYVNAPIWLIGQFNMVKDLLANGSFVESFQAPFFCLKSQESKALTLEVGKDIPVLSDYGTYKVPNRKVDGKEFEVDFVPERYFSFISENIEQFKVLSK